MRQRRLFGGVVVALALMPMVQKLAVITCDYLPGLCEIFF